MNKRLLLKFIELQEKVLTTSEVVWLENFAQYLDDISVNNKKAVEAGLAQVIGNDGEVEYIGTDKQWSKFEELKNKNNEQN